MSKLPVNLDGHNVQTPGRLELLEVYELRRRVERVAVAAAEIRRESLAMTSVRRIRHLRDLISAIRSR